MTTPATIEKRCRANRYCAFAGPFHGEHLVSADGGRSQLVGRCYAFDCGAYVCNRCAHRRPVPGSRAPRFPGVLDILCCPFDGAPLGVGNDWLVLDATGEVVRRSAGLPELDDALVADLVRLQCANALSRRDRCVELLSAAQDLARQGADQALAVCDRALALEPRHPLGWLTRRACLEAMGRHGDAWVALRTLLRLEPDDHAQAVLDLERLESRHDAEQRAPTRVEKLVLRYREDLVSWQRTPRASGEPAGFLSRGRWTDGTARPRVVPSPRKETTAPVVLLTGAPAETVRRILERVSPERWYGDEWKAFLAQCERHAGIVFPDGVEGFLRQLSEWKVDHELLGSPIVAQLTVELRHDVLRVSGQIGRGALHERYVAQCCLASQQLRGMRFGRDEAVALGETLAREASRSAEPTVDGDILARTLETAAAALKASQWRLAIDEAARVCPAFCMDGHGGLGFSYAGFHDWFLARAVFASLFTGAEPDFELVGRRLLPDGAARFIEELARPQRQRATMALQHWLSRNRRHASLFQGADIPVLVRNLALIQLRLVRRAHGIDLSEADFSGLSLDGADFTGSQLGGASFRGANVSRARFYDAVLVGATFEGASATDARFARARTDLSDLPEVEDVSG